MKKALKALAAENKRLHKELEMANRRIRTLEFESRIKSEIDLLYVAGLGRQS